MPTFYESSLPARANDEQLYISLTLEADDTGIGRLKRVHTQFDLHSSYSLDSDIPALYTMPSESELRRPPPSKTARKLAVFISSRCKEPRTSFVEELMQYMQIDSYGKCLHNADLPQHERVYNSADPVLSVIGQVPLSSAVVDFVVMLHLTALSCSTSL